MCDHIPRIAGERQTLSLEDMNAASDMKDAGKTRMDGEAAGVGDAADAVAAGKPSRTPGTESVVNTAISYSRIPDVRSKLLR